MTAIGSSLGIGGKGKGDQTALAQSSVAPSNLAAGDIYNRAMAQAASANAIQAPTAVVSPGQTAAQINSGLYNVNTNTNAQVEDATLKMRAYQAALAQASDAAVQNVKQADITKVAAVQGADVAKVGTTVTAPTIGPAAQTGAVKVGGTQIDPLANELRDQQIAGANAIANGPSAAMSQFQAGQSQVAKDQLAVAAGARGAERAGARREAMINIGAGGAQANLSAAALAAQETQAKNNAYVAALQGVRGQDVTTSTAQASIDSQQANLQAQLDTSIATGNTAAVNSIKQQQAALGLQAQQSTVQAGLTQQGTLADVAKYNTGLQEQTALANATATNKAAADAAAASNAAYGQYAGNATAISQGNATATTGAAKDYASAINAAAQTTASAQTNTNLANTALTQQQAQANATRAAGLETTNALQQNAVNAQNATNSIGAQTTNASNQLNASQLQQTGATAALNAGTGAVGIQSKNAQTIVDANKAASDTAQKEDAATKGLIGAGIAQLSDERAKDDIAPVGGVSYASELRRGPYESVGEDYWPGDKDKEAAKRSAETMAPADVDNWAARVNPITYRYKPGMGEDDGADPHLGLSAQELESSGPLGRLMVHRDPKDGMRRVDYGAATLMLSRAAFDKADEALRRASQKGAR
jgi:hypothetical protein